MEPSTVPTVKSSLKPADKKQIRKLKIIPDDKITSQVPVHVHVDVQVQANTVNSYTLGDNLILLKGVASDSIDMIYMDPPYNTGRDFFYFQDKFADFPKFMEERIIECHRIVKNT